MWQYREPGHYKSPHAVSSVKSCPGERARSFEFDDDADTGNYQESPVNPITGRFAK